jgi:hypothetical protein
MTKAELQKHVEKLGDELFFEHHGCLTGDCPHMTQRECSIHAFTEGVTATLELLFHLVEDFQYIKSGNGSEVIMEIITRRLAELEKKVRGE